MLYCGDGVGDLDLAVAVLGLVVKGITEVVVNLVLLKVVQMERENEGVGEYQGRWYSWLSLETFPHGF